MIWINFGTKEPVLKSQDINMLLANAAVLSGQKAVFTDADIESIEWSLLDKVCSCFY